MRKTISQPWKLRLVFSRDHDEVIELPGALSTRSVWQHVRETYYPRRPAIQVLTRGGKQLKV